MTFRLIIAGLLLMGSMPGLAAGNISEAAVLFLVIPMDIRARGMGVAGVALPGHAFALDVNPALLVETKFLGLGGGMGDWLPSLDDDYDLEAAHATVSGRDLGYPVAVGIGFKQIDLGTQVRTDASGNVLGTFESREKATTFGIAGSPHRNVAIGISAKHVFSMLGDFGAGTEQGLGEADLWLYDFGVYAHGLIPQATYTPRSPSFLKLSCSECWSISRSEGFGIGYSIQNVGEDIVYIDSVQSDPPPRLATLGISFRAINNEAISFLLTAEMRRDIIHNSFDQATDLFIDAVSLNSEPGDIVSWGIELNLLHLVDLRVGHVIDKLGGLRPWAYGIGIGTDRFQVNYARMSQEGSPVDGTDMWGASLRWEGF